jgi:hypothetical protein
MFDRASSERRKNVTATLRTTYTAVSVKNRNTPQKNTRPAPVSWSLFIVQ